MINDYAVFEKEKVCSCCGKSLRMRTNEPDSSLTAWEMTLDVFSDANITQEDFKRYMGGYYVEGATYYRVSICHECFYKAMGVKKYLLETK